MRQLESFEIKQVSLDILKDVHAFCSVNKIHYTLAYGTLLGAVRHKGFIPWDDDIDIMMPRPDYERFCKVYSSSKGYVCLSYPNSYMPFARVCDTIKTVADEGLLPWTKIPHGVWIDVFPIDGAEDSMDKLMKRFQKAKLYRRLLFYYRGAQVDFSDLHSLSDKIKILIKKIFFKTHSSTPALQRIISRIEYEHANYVTNLSCPDDWGAEHFKKEMFDNYLKLQFEDTEFCVISAYDQMLKEYYGDYMRLPPIEQQVARHDGVTYFWKRQ